MGSNSITDVIGRLKVLEGRIQQLEEEKKEFTKSVSQGWEEVREAIRSGKSTDDRIKDFVIMRYGKQNKECEGVYRDLQERLAGKAGQFVLMAEAREKEAKFRLCSMLPPQDDDRFSKTYEHLSLGVLSGEMLIFSVAENLCTIPIGGNLAYYTGELSWEGEHVLQEKQPMLVSTPDGERDLVLQYGKTFRDHLGEKDRYQLDVLVGNDEVMGWFAKMQPFRQKILYRMARMLDRPLEGDTTGGNPYLAFPGLR
ncbi:MAG: hypothetical protein AAB581_03820 [Patescibacteria group bacterium]